MLKVGRYLSEPCFFSSDAPCLSSCTAVGGQACQGLNRARNLGCCGKFGYAGNETDEIWDV